jgi:uncharacterized membrane protein YbhN (UPF0104 family)
MSTWKKTGKRVLQFGLPLVILAALAYSLRSSWSQLAGQRIEFNLWMLGAAFLGFCLQVLSYGLIWRAILQHLGHRLDFLTCLRVYLGSEFVRYIPGNVWHVLARILWVGKYGVPRPLAFASMVIELVTKLAAGALVFAFSLLFWSDAGSIATLWSNSLLLPVLGLVLIVALLIMLHPRILGTLLNIGLRLLKRQPVTLGLHYQHILLITLYWSLSWCIAGAACYLLLLSIWPSAPLVLLPISIGIYALVWDIGFLSLITPSGLGVREAAMTAIFSLAFALPAGVATMLALISRIVSTLAELLCVSIAYVAGGKRGRRLVLERAQDGSIEVSEPGMSSGKSTIGEQPTSLAATEGGAGSD